MTNEKIKVNQIEIYIEYDNLKKVNWNEIRDSPDKIPIIVMHGHMANHFYLKPIYYYFKNRGWPVLSFDLRGHGWSEKSLAGKYKIDYCVEDLYQIYQEFLLKKFGYQKFYLIGHSMGGFISQKYAIKYPETLSKLVLLSTSSCLVSNKLIKLLFFMIVFYWKIFYNHILKNKKKRHIRLGIENFPQWKDTSLLPDKQASIEFLKDIGDFCVLNQIESIKIPVLVCVGSKDDIKHQSKIIADKIPNAEFILLDGYEHNIAIHAKEKIAEKIYEFLIK